MAPLLERPDMADYGVPDTNEGLLPWSWAEERLVNSRNYWIVTATPTGRPHAMPVWGAWLPDRERFWFSCAASARKARNLQANDQIVVAPTDTVEVVSLEGRAVDVSGGDLGDHVQAFFDKYGAEMGQSLEEVGEFLTSNTSFEVTPERAFGMIERPDEFSERATRWRWI